MTVLPIDRDPEVPCTSEHPDCPGLTCNLVRHPDDVAHYARGFKWQDLPPAAGHVATFEPEGATGYLVTCPHGCKLGTTAHTATLGAALRRVRLHADTTAHHAPKFTPPPTDPQGPLCAGWDNPDDSDEVEDLGPDCTHLSCHLIAIPSHPGSLLDVWDRWVVRP
jgi:hypothetical protein